MIRYAAKSTGATLLAIVLFATPLILKYHVYRTQVVHTIPGDIIPLNQKMSTIWCEGIELTSTSTFSAYLYDTYPDVKEGQTQRSHALQHIMLPNRAQEYWGFHFLKGTTVSVSMCVRLSGGQLLFVKGSHNVRKCIDEHHSHWSATGDSFEEDESEEESDEQTSSISSSQGVVSNETDDLFECSEALYHARVQSNYRCTSSLSWLLSKKMLYTHLVEDTDFYYFLFSSNTYLDILPNEFFVEFVFDRTRYNFSTSSFSCSNSTECVLPVPFLSDKLILVEFPAVNGTWNTEELETTCSPRKGIFFGFYVAFAVVIFICAFH